MPEETLALAVLGHGLVDPDRPWLRVDDEAVLRGRAVFETLRVYAGRPFRLPAHLERLTRSARVLGLDAPDSLALTDLVGESLAQPHVGDAVLRVVWTAGADATRPVGFALVTALPEGLEQARTAGIELRSLQLAIGATARRASPWLLPGVKSTSYAVNIAAQTEARRRGADDALFLSLEGIVLEGPTSNVWFVEDGVLHTPALDLGILAGVTRDTLVDVAADARITVESGAYELDRLARATEVFTSSSIREVMPVVRLDGAAIADGRPGPVAAAMQTGLRAAAMA
ncbi:MAG TPA: aminotransferase class IV [Gaiellales bacterium]|jgi:4-amino-4-deoxychorismate lyase